MKKYIAPLLIAIMALSVLSAAGVVTTQTVAAQPIATAVTYRTGATYGYRPSQFNNDYTALYPSAGTPTLSATASYGTASASVSATSTQAGSSFANVWMYWHITNWNTNLENKPCKVTVMVTYQIKSRGTNAIAFASWGPYTGGNYNYYGNEVWGTSATKVATTVYMWHGTVGELFTNGYGYASGYIGGVVSGPGQASGTITISCIWLTFPTRIQ